MDNNVCLSLLLTAVCVSLCESAHNGAGTLCETDIFAECVLCNTSSKGCCRCNIIKMDLVVK